MESDFITWTQSFEVGHKGLDAEHRRLVKIINEINAAERNIQAPAQLGALLRTLVIATVEHLRHENSVMRLELLETMGVDAINEHCAEHALALFRLEAAIQDFCSKNAFPEQQLSWSLKDWFIQHAIKHDAHLKAFL